MATTDQALLSGLQRRLAEPDDAGASWPSGYWTAAEVLELVNQRQASLAERSQLFLGIWEIPVLALQQTVALPSDLLAIVDAAWENLATATFSPLDPVGPFSLDHGLRDWAIEPGTPRVYQHGAQGDLTSVVIAPAAASLGRLHLVGVPTPDRVDGTGQLLVVPDEVASAILPYGVLEDLLTKPGRAADPGRAAWARARYEEGLEALRLILAGWRGG